MNVVGVERAVLIQPSLYGFDHSYLLACLQEHPSRLSAWHWQTRSTPFAHGA